MKRTKKSEAKLAYKMGQSWGQQIVALVIGMLFTMFIVWLTLPSSSQRLINKKCFKVCKVKIETEGYNMGFFSGPSYIEALKKCHNECSSVIR